MKIMSIKYEYEKYILLEEDEQISKYGDFAPEKIKNYRGNTTLNFVLDYIYDIVKTDIKYLKNLDHNYSISDEISIYYKNNLMLFIHADNTELVKDILYSLKGKKLRFKEGYYYTNMKFKTDIEIYLK